MAALIGSIFLALAAVGLIGVLGIAAAFRAVMSVAAETRRVFGDASLGDEARELFAQQNSLRLFGLFLRIVSIVAVALGAPLVVLWLADRFGLLSLAATLHLATSPAFLAASLGLAAAAVWLGRGRQGAEHSGVYSPLDKLVHRLAFATWPLQAAIADMEPLLFKAELDGVTIERPVFVAGLPRAGTTLLLRLIEGAGGFASYRYGDMPFLLTPLLWGRFARGAKAAVAPRERTHGDGVDIDLASPEAFEEVAWRTPNGRLYKGPTLPLWPRRLDEDFAPFFRLQMRKVIAARRQAGAGSLRYLSKNNGNVARLRTIAALFPDAIVLVPFRRPLDQAASLHRQHLGFLALHDRDPFARRYMQAIGHYDFGANLKPVAFPGLKPGLDFTRVDAWLEYWCAAYGYLADQHALVGAYVGYERLCGDREATLSRLAARLDMPPEALLWQADTIRSDLRPASAETDRDLLERAEAIYERLVALAGRQGR